VQNAAIAAAVQAAPHVRAPAAIIDLIAITNVEARLGAVPPDGMLDEPVDLAGIDPRGNGKQSVGAAAWVVAANAIRVGRRKPIEDASAMQEVVDESVDDDNRRPDVEPAGASRASPDQQPSQGHANGLIGDPIDILQRANERRPGCGNIGGVGCDLPINPLNDVAIGNVADEQKQTVRSLV
jgi:hypothetical protein